MGALIFRGIILGAIYMLASVGLSLQWGVLKNLNFSHGACITFGALIMYLGTSVWATSYFTAFLMMLVMAVVLGIAIEWLTVRPFFGKNDTNIFLATVALSTVMAQIYFIIFGGREKPLPPIVEGNFQIGSIRGTYHELFTIVIAVLTIALFWYILSKTKIGLAIRAVSQSPTGAILNGINTRRVYSITMGFATAIAGIAGMLLGPIYYVGPHMGEGPMVKAFIIVILGGLGSLKGTMVAAFIVAFVEVFIGVTLGVTWAPLVLYLLMAVILIFKPEGLFGVSLRKA